MITTVLLLVTYNIQNVLNTARVRNGVSVSTPHLTSLATALLGSSLSNWESNILPIIFFCHHVISHIKNTWTGYKISIVRSMSTVNGIAVRLGMLMFPDNRTDGRTERQVWRRRYEIRLHIFIPPHCLQPQSTSKFNPEPPIRLAVRSITQNEAKWVLHLNTKVKWSAVHSITFGVIEQCG